MDVALGSTWPVARPKPTVRGDCDASKDWKVMKNVAVVCRRFKVRRKAVPLVSWNTRTRTSLERVNGKDDGIETFGICPRS